MALPSQQPGAAVHARALPARSRRTAMSRLALLAGAALLTLVTLVALAIPLVAAVYATVGTDAPFVVNARGPAKGPAPTGSRIEAAVVAAVFLCLWAAFLRLAVLRRLAPPYVTVDAEGVWLGRGRRRMQGLAWDRIAAVGVIMEAESGGGGTAVARVPYLDLYPVEKAAEEPGTLLGDRLVNARPAAPRLRGKRYVIELAATGTATGGASGRAGHESGDESGHEPEADPESGAAGVARAVDTYAPDKRLRLTAT